MFYQPCQAIWINDTRTQRFAPSPSLPPSFPPSSPPLSDVSGTSSARTTSTITQHKTTRTVPRTKKRTYRDIATATTGRSHADHTRTRTPGLTHGPPQLEPRMRRVVPSWPDRPLQSWVKRHRCQLSREEGSELYPVRAAPACLRRGIQRVLAHNRRHTKAVIGRRYKRGTRAKAHTEAHRHTAQRHDHKRARRTHTRTLPMRSARGAGGRGEPEASSLGPGCSEASPPSASCAAERRSAHICSP